MKIEFVEFQEVADQKYIGLATVKLDDKIYLRYKLQKGKDGKGWFFQEASHKIAEDTYVASFIVDSKFLQEKIDNVLRENTRIMMDGHLQTVN